MTLNFRSLFRKAAFMAFVGLAIPSSLLAATGDLKPDDFVGVSFWVISMALIAATAFFFLEIQRVAPKWKTSLTVSGLVCLVASVHYLYMRDIWVATGDTPTVFRYIDWLITVPLLMVEFFLILSAVTKVSSSVFWRLIIGTLVMLVFGYLGEAGIMNAMTAFILSMAGWAFIIYEIYVGEAGKVNAASATPSVKRAFGLMRLIVVFGWAIYPIGYVLGYLTGGEPADSATMLNVVYNLADFINKIGFGVIIWSCAVAETDSK